MDWLKLTEGPENVRSRIWGRETIYMKKEMNF